MRQWWRIVERRSHQRFEKVNPQPVTWELSGRLPDGAILTAGSGSSTTWWARQVRPREGMKTSLSGTPATMGPGTPYAIAAKFAYPDRPVIAFVGDGAFQMNGLNEMITVKRYTDRLGHSPLIFCVFNNEDLNQVTWEQRAMAGDPKYTGTQHIPDMAHHRRAEPLDLTGIYCEDHDGAGAAWDRAFAANSPVVLEFKVDQAVPPIPPHIMGDQGKKAAKAALHDPKKIGITVKDFRQKSAEAYETLPGRDER